MNKALFFEMRDKIVSTDNIKNGIGTLQEKTLHRIIKHYLEPSEERHEIKIGSYVADIVGENGIVEIQTRQFNAMRAKLDAFLSVGNVTIVYPITNIKYLSWINMESGEGTALRKCPKRGKIYDIIPELYKIKDKLINENLKFMLIFLDIDEYRYLNGWDKDKKRGSSRFDRIPKDIIDEVFINCKNDYNIFLPDSLPREFTTKDLKKAASIHLSVAQTCLNILNYIGVVERIGKQGSLILYKKKEL